MWVSGSSCSLLSRTALTFDLLSQTQVMLHRLSPSSFCVFFPYLQDWGPLGCVKTCRLTVGTKHFDKVAVFGTLCMEPAAPERASAAAACDCIQFSMWPEATLPCCPLESSQRGTGRRDPVTVWTWVWAGSCARAFSSQTHKQLQPGFGFCRDPRSLCTVFTSDLLICAATKQNSEWGQTFWTVRPKKCWALLWNMCLWSLEVRSSLLEWLLK